MDGKKTVTQMTLDPWGKHVHRLFTEGDNRPINTLKYVQKKICALQCRLRKMQIKHDNFSTC